MSKLNGGAYEIVTGLAELGEEMERRPSSFEVTNDVIDLVNSTSCFIQKQDDEIKRLREALEDISCHVDTHLQVVISNALEGGD